jgi:hypothetical protein
MSVSHNHRRKTIRQFKKKYGAKWRNFFIEHCAAIRRANEGPCLGTLADLSFLNSPSIGGLAGAAGAAPVSP